MVGKVLVTGQHATAGPYIPTFYQECTGIKCPTTVKVSIIYVRVRACDTHTLEQVDATTTGSLVLCDSPPSSHK